MKKMLFLIAIVVATTGSLLATHGLASAKQPEPIISVSAVEQVDAGQRHAVAAYLIDPLGNPIYDAEVDFTFEVEFLNVTSAVEIGSAITDETGLALLEFSPTVEGVNLITASFHGNEVFAEAFATTELSVISNGRLYKELPPYRVPGANMWLTAGLIATVWLIFIGSLGLVGWANIRTRGEQGGSNA